MIFAVHAGVATAAASPASRRPSGVKRPIDDGDAMIAEALRYADYPNGRVSKASVTAGEGTGEVEPGVLGRLRRAAS